jgi:hypothetical protein
MFFGKFLFARAQSVSVRMKGVINVAGKERGYPNGTII